MTINISENKKLMDKGQNKKTLDYEKYEQLNGMPVNQRIRPSIWSLITRLIWDQIFFLFLIFLLIITFVLINSLQFTIIGTIPIVILIVVFLLLDAISFLIRFYNWMHTYYYFDHKDTQVLKVGRFLFNNRVSVYTLNENSDVQLYQSFIGKILGYGTLKITGPTIEKAVYIRYIRNPDIALAALEKIINSKKGDTDLISTNII
jgi:hypothetical protein